MYLLKANKFCFLTLKKHLSYLIPFLSYFPLTIQNYVLLGYLYFSSKIQICILGEKKCKFVNTARLLNVIHI